MRDDGARRDSSGRIIVIVAIAFLEKDGSSSFFDCHVEDGFGNSRQFSEFWSEKKSQILPEKLSLTLFLCQQRHSL